ncbi:hypothetical protein [Limosilactobacillus reuteri]|uniref:hypothetical protein n=1 Tax=Limosilactobacillus reuteri TaxID=1598 RepID=UPI002B052D36|nr:hypothetical protein [Limosilactobacillus reuteri]
MEERKYIEELTAQIDELKKIVMILNDHIISFKEARKVLFHGKSPEWIEYHIVDRFPEIRTDVDPVNGWINPRMGKGHPRYVTSFVRAKLWLNDNRAQIDWQSPEPKTVRKNAA